MNYQFSAYTKDARFTDLSRSVQFCSLCTRLCSRTKVLSKYNGNIESDIIFIAEAPGRLGADRTGIPLYGDKTGDNFENLLSNIGWQRDEIFITNAVLCNPREESGNNSTPTKEEIFNCLPYLAMTIELINPKLIVTLGAVALRALDFIEPHAFILKEHVATPMKWHGRYVFPLYHPGPRAMIHRSLSKQRADFMALDNFAKRMSTLESHFNKVHSKKEFSDFIETRFFKLAQLILSRLGKISYFRLTKLLYLVDYYSIEKLGVSTTGEIYLRQLEGPWPPALKKLTSLPSSKFFIITNRNKIPYIELDSTVNMTFNNTISFDTDILDVIEYVILAYGYLNNREIKTAAYLTKPMKYILNQEKKGRDMRRIPVIYANKHAEQIDVSSVMG